MRYSFNSRIRYSEVGADYNLTMLSLLDYFQDASIFNSEAVGRDFRVLDRENRAWFLSSWQIVVDRYPSFGETVTISTWPYDFRNVFGDRNFLMTDENGNRLAWANSIWVYTDTSNGRAVRVPQSEHEAYQFSERLDMDYAPRKIRTEGKGRKEASVLVMKHHLDTNNHVNNGQYVLIAAECLPDGLQIAQMRAEYKHPAVLDDIIVPEVFENGGVYTVVLRSEDDKVFAVVEFIGK